MSYLKFHTDHLLNLQVENVHHEITIPHLGARGYNRNEKAIVQPGNNSKGGSRWRTDACFNQQVILE